MAWIDLTGLGKYHEKIKAWIEKNKYVHPANHPATMIIQDNLNQFVSKEQKNTWNNKLDADANAVSASKLNKPVRINGIEFDGTKDISISSEAKINIVLIEMEISANEKTIKVNETNKITSKSNLWLFVDGIKLIKNKHYTINEESNSIILKESYQNSINVEVIIF